MIPKTFLTIHALPQVANAILHPFHLRISDQERKSVVDDTPERHADLKN
jgi:hypothetical protein